MLNHTGLVQSQDEMITLAVQNMGYAYLQRRSDLVADVLRQSQTFGMREEIAHDGILLMDRIMSTSLQASFCASSSLLIGTRAPERGMGGILTYVRVIRAFKDATCSVLA